MKVLIIDDEVDMGEILAHLIRRNGFEVEFLQDTNLAKKAIQLATTDVILCDMNMPQMSGAEFYVQNCRELDSHFIILTGDITASLEEIYTTGIKHVLFKPKDLARIIPLLKELTLERQ